MTCDIIIVSHRKDLCWLSYSLQFWEKNWKEHGSKIIVRIEEDCREIVETWGVNVVYRYVKKWPDGYTFQMYQKMIADDYSDADLLLMADSDLMLLKPARLSDLMQDGKPVVEYVEWDTPPGIAERVWRAPTSRVMGIDLDRDYMVSMPCLYWRDTFNKTRQQIVNTTGKGFFESVYSDKPFTAKGFMTHPMTFADYEALSLFAVKFQPEKYVLRHLSERPEDRPFKLFWSHGDWSPEVQAYLDKHLRSPLIDPVPVLKE